MGNLQPARSDHPILNERELSFITLHTHFTQKQITEFHIRFLTHYPHGYVNFQQFCKLYSSELKHLHDSRPLLECLFHHIDTDRDGRLNFREILFFKAVTMPETGNDEKLLWIFFLYDTDLDQYIDESEFMNLCHVTYHIHGQLLTRTRYDELQTLFRKIDTNKDRKINCDEFIRLCSKCTDLLQMITPMFKDTEWNLNNNRRWTCATTYELTPDRINYLMNRTKFTREQILNYYVTFREQCHSGHLTKTEFVHFFQKLLSSNASQVYCEYLFRAFDCLSRDGFIEFNEYILAIYIHSNSSTTREKLEWLFNAYDRDGDGFISYKEINDIVYALFILYGNNREQLSVIRTSQNIMALLDLNNDGKLSKQEFMNVIQNEELTKFLAPSFVQ